jgi:hypothetical protein
MRTIAAVLAVVLLGQMTTEDRAERLAKMAQRIDVQAAAGEVGEWQNVLRYALANRNADLAKKAREGVKNAKRDFAKAKDRSARSYMDRARRAVEDEDRPDQNPGNRVSGENLTAGEWALERIRYAGPAFICGAILEDDIGGVPVLTIAVGNRSDRTIDAYDVEIECWNAFDEPVGAGGDNVMGGTCQTPLSESEIATAKWSLFGHQTATRVTVRITRIKPAYGNIWEQTREEAERAPGAIVTATMRR